MNADNPQSQPSFICPFCAEDVKKEAVVCKHCGREITPKSTIITQENKDNANPKSNYYIQGAPVARIQCKVCNSGVMTKHEIYRMSMPVVIIGYIFLVPSILGIIISGWGTIISIIGGNSLLSDNKETAGLSGMFSGISGCLGLVSIVVFFVAGIIGWLLVMKKKVLKCGSCGATVDCD